MNSQGQVVNSQRQVVKSRNSVFVRGFFVEIVMRSLIFHRSGGLLVD